MLNTTTQTNCYISHQSDNRKNKPKHYSHKQSASVTENRFAQIPKKMPYQHHPMTQITSSLIDALPMVNNL